MQPSSVICLLSTIVAVATAPTSSPTDLCARLRNIHDKEIPLLSQAVKTEMESKENLGRPADYLFQFPITPAKAGVGMIGRALGCFEQKPAEETSLEEKCAQLKKIPKDLPRWLGGLYQKEWKVILLKFSEKYSMVFMEIARMVGCPDAEKE